MAPGSSARSRVVIPVTFAAWNCGNGVYWPMTKSTSSSANSSDSYSARQNAPVTKSRIGSGYGSETSVKFAQPARLQIWTRAVTTNIASAAVLIDGNGAIL